LQPDQRPLEPLVAQFEALSDRWRISQRTLGRFCAASVTAGIANETSEDNAIPLSWHALSSMGFDCVAGRPCTGRRLASRTRRHEKPSRSGGVESWPFFFAVARVLPLFAVEILKFVEEDVVPQADG